jgi:pilus assembly protein FimV
MRALARWGITPLLAAPAGAWALALGDIELQSALNQPFRAEIALSATPDELQTLRITVADGATFERYGLDRPNFLGTFEFRVVTSRDGRSIIQVASRESIAEPFVEMLLEATWPRGRSLKVYTVFLDPPVLLPAPAAPPALTPAETRPSSGAAPGGQISRPSPPPAAEPQAPAPAPAVTEPNVSRATPAAPRAPVSDEGGVYGPVQRGETLSRIADRVRPEDVTLNQMMIAIFEANPQAFAGNINVLRAGTTLRLPDSTSLGELAVTTANAEVRRQIDEWRDRTAQGGQLRLLPPSDTEVARAPVPAPAPTQAAVPTPPAPVPAAGGAADAVAAAGLDESRRLLELRNAELQNLQQQAEAAGEPAVETEPPPAAEPGVDLESEQLFADETEPVVEPEAEVPAPAPAPAIAPPPAAAEPSLVSQALDWLGSPFVWIGVGVALVLLTALWFVRRRRTDTEDVTGRWEALESETDDQTRDATERMRRHAPEQTIVVEEQHAASLRPAAEPEPAPRRAAPARPPAQAAHPVTPADETLSSQTVINLDQADAVAEADFHIAYGLYDQAAELVQKALEAAPDRRDLKLKLLEVYFMWGNKDAFLKAAHALRGDLKQGDDADWSKVVIMGRQICPDESLFTEAMAGGGRVDVDLEAGGDAPLDLAFDELAAAEAPAGSSGLDFNLESSDERPAPKPAAKSASKPTTSRDFQDSSLDIGSRTAAGLEAALFESSGDDDDTGKRTTPDIPADALAITQESPTIERPGRSDWATAENTALQLSADAPTMETPTIESPAARSASTMSTKTVAIPRRGAEPPTVEQPALASAAPTEYTAEIDLDDLGLDVKDIEGLPTDLGDLPMAAGRETDTRQQPALREDDALLSATGVTKVLHGEEDDSLAASTSVLEDQDATMMAPGFDEGTSTMTGTAVLDSHHQLDSETGSTSLVKSLGKKKGVDLDLDDLTAALHGADTVEQPRANAFSRDVFGGGGTPVDLDIGADVSADDAPTGTEEAALDPQTMTEIGTKLDLARAYIDMGDPEGARSILEEVIDEGDSTQRREAQGLIDALSA